MINIRQLFFIGVLVAVFGDATFAASVSLAWNPSTDPTAAGYHVYYWDAGAASSNLLFAAGLVTVGVVTNATVTNLVVGGTYTFAATTLDASGVESLLSNEVTYQVPSNTVVVAPVSPNHPPMLNALAALTITENSGAQTVPLTGITTGASNEVQTLTVTAASSNPNLISALTVNYASPGRSGTLGFSPATNAYGTATITVTVNDGGASNNLVTQSFTVTVSQVDSTPTLDPLGNLGFIQNSGTHTIALNGIGSGVANPLVGVIIIAASSNPNVISTPIVNYFAPNTNGMLSLTPVAGTTGVATITVTVNNYQPSNNIFTRAFTVTVLPLGSTPPSITSSPTNKVAAAGQAVSFSVTAAGTGPLNYQWQCNSTNLPAGTNATLNLTNLTTGQAGQYSVSVSNPLGSTNTAAALTVYATAAASLVATKASSPGQFNVAVAGVSGFQYAVQASTNLTGWVSLQTNTAPFNFTDTNAGKFKQRYYRTVYLP